MPAPGSSPRLPTLLALSLALSLSFPAHAQTNTNALAEARLGEAIEKDQVFERLYNHSQYRNLARTLRARLEPESSDSGDPPPGSAPPRSTSPKKNSNILKSGVAIRHKWSHSPRVG